MPLIPNYPQNHIITVLIICFVWHGVKVGPGPQDPGPQDPGLRSKFKSGTPGPSSKFKSGTPGSSFEV